MKTGVNLYYRDNTNFRLRITLGTNENWIKTLTNPGNYNSDASNGF